MPPDPNDITVLIPRVRRAVDGPMALGSASVASTLTDDQVKALVADAIASVIWYTAGAWGHTLTVEDRDEMYGSPTEWSVAPVLTEPEQTVVAAQAALDYYMHSLQSMKSSERIADEGQEWEWATSAAALAERLKELRAARDRALELVAALGGGITTNYVSFLAERDAYTAALVEPWVAGALVSREGIW